MHNGFVHIISFPVGPSSLFYCAYRCSRLCRGSSAWEGRFREAQHAPAAQHKDRCSNSARDSFRRRRSWQGKGHRWRHWPGRPLQMGSMSNTKFQQWVSCVPYEALLAKTLSVKCNIRQPRSAWMQQQDHRFAAEGAAGMPKGIAVHTGLDVPYKWGA